MALPNRPCAVLLDLDDTLIDGSGLIRSTIAVSAAFATRHPELGLDPAALARANGIAWQRTWSERESEWVRGELDDYALSTAVWTAALGDLGIPDPERYAGETAREHLAALATATKPFDDALPALDALAAADISIGIVTNGSTNAQRAKVEMLGAERFAFVGITGEHGLAKPDPQIFHVVLDALGLAADQVVHVGDSLHSDIGGAAAAGIASVWLNRPNADGVVADRPADAAIPDAEIVSLAQLSAVLGVGAVAAE